MLACTLSAFPADFAYTFDAWLHPDGTTLDFSWQAGLFQIAVNILLTILIAFPLMKLGSKMIDTIKEPNVWLSVLFVSFVFLLLSVTIIPRNYNILYEEQCFFIYIVILIILLILLLFQYASLYIIAMGIQKNADLTQRIRFFEMQESQYNAQKKYIEETSRSRHDFRQSILTLNRLTAEDDIPSLKKYLGEYVSALPKTESVCYCKNKAVNALLNYYAHTAAEKDIRIEWHIDLPESLNIAPSLIYAAFWEISWKMRCRAA